MNKYNRIHPSCQKGTSKAAFLYVDKWKRVTNSDILLDAHLWLSKSPSLMLHQRKALSLEDTLLPIHVWFYGQSLIEQCEILTRHPSPPIVPLGALRVGG